MHEHEVHYARHREVYTVPLFSLEYSSEQCMASRRRIVSLIRVIHSSACFCLVRLPKPEERQSSGGSSLQYH